MGLNLKTPHGADGMAKAGEEAEAALLGTAARMLMCAPMHYRVDYTINPWMENQIGKADNALAIRQWTNLARLLAREAELAFVAPTPGLPDMVFTANAGLAIGGTAVVSHFATKEREAEERPFRAWFEAEGFEIAPWPWNIAFEGAGDALLDNSRSLIWCGHGWRSSARAAPLLETIFARRVVGLRLVDPRFYHLDTCFCPLADGWLIYYPPAFDAASRQAIAELVPAGETHRGRRGRRAAVRVQRRRGQWTRLHERRLGRFTAPLARGRVRAGADGSFGIHQGGRSGQMSDVEIARDIGAGCSERAHGTARRPDFTAL